ncbi:MAG TPA: hypothetical protein ENJ52_06195 [Aliiroseovarius sp.]|nr:hypothetical protein [Aliiroseovarius sp.]
MMIPRRAGKGVSKIIEQALTGSSITGRAASRAALFASGQLRAGADHRAHPEPERMADPGVVPVRLVPCDPVGIENRKGKGRAFVHGMIG